jgi:N-acetyl-1-D-myo-inositol-2-amino-2-deoxy-alpha-D-glucopyranoside deacetylase
VLGVFPHPDDEAYAAGGLLAQCAANGALVELLCATRGENGADRNAATPPGSELAGQRTRELQASCLALGVAAPAFLDLPDGGLAEDGAAAAALIERHIERLQPHLIVTLGNDGVYAHLDHLACTAIATAAVSRARRPIRLLYSVFPRQLFAPLWRVLHRRPGAAMVADVDPRTLGVDAPELRLDIRAVRDRKLAAIAAHRSQLVGGDPLTFLRPGLVERLLDEEWYVVAHGPALPAGASDPFAGL